MPAAAVPTMTVEQLQERMAVAGRPVLLDLADRAGLREIAGEWVGRVGVVSATLDERPADALLILPDARIGWAATADEPGETASPGLREALTTWFGAPG